MNFPEPTRSDQSKIMKQLFKLNWGAHHPSCEKYNHHLIRIVNHPLCIGCTFMSLGLISGILILVFTNLHSVAPLTIWLLGLFFYFSAIIQTKLTKNKHIKMVLRYFLGIGASFMLAAVVLIPLSFSTLFVKLFLFWLFYFIFQKTMEFRAKRINDPCIDCADGTFPLCIHKKSEMSLILKNNQRNEMIMGEKDEKLIPLLTILVNQFDGGEKSVMFESDFEHTNECDNNISTSQNSHNMRYFYNYKNETEL